MKIYEAILELQTKRAESKISKLASKIEKLQAKRLNNDLKSTQEAMQKTNKQAEKFNKSMKEAQKHSRGLLNSIKGVGMFLIGAVAALAAKALSAINIAKGTIERRHGALLAGVSTKDFEKAEHATKQSGVRYDLTELANSGMDMTSAEAGRLFTKREDFASLDSIQKARAINESVKELLKSQGEQNAKSILENLQGAGLKLGSDVETAIKYAKSGLGDEFFKLFDTDTKHINDYYKKNTESVNLQSERRLNKKESVLNLTARELATAFEPLATKMLDMQTKLLQSSDFKKAIAGFGDFVDMGVNVLSKVYDIITQKIIPALTSTWEWLNNNIVPIFKSAWEMLSQFIDSIKKLIDIIGNFNIGSKVAGAWQSTKDFFTFDKGKKDALKGELNINIKQDSSGRVIASAPDVISLQGRAQ